ncbi:LytTR family DNA-binding domain-containing protein [Roseivirga sp. E12]|uniref:LytR/AlgR family response regulator transcription factor n=1 Tax=Roseivirga sp. E12 TaxID=2819237 RepID=UPI001ABC51C3|nr:LytTR family DNA-binding domain-containing protein [Roseivirga sp. E12]
MDFLFLRKNRVWIITVFWLIVGVLLTTKSALGQLHANGTNTWFQNFFYQGSGVLIWGLLTPLLIRFTKRFDLLAKEWEKPLVAHLTLSIPLALIHRGAAILVDFSVRDLVGEGLFESWNPFDVLYNFRLVILGSALSNFVIYWIIVVLISSILFYRKRNINRGSEVLSARNAKIKHLKVKVEGAFRMIALDEIISCEASGNYIDLITNEEKYRIRDTMKSLESKLDYPFVRVHRSSIVNLDHLASFQHLYQGEYLLKFKNGRQLTSTKRYRSNLLPIVKA